MTPSELSAKFPWLCLDGVALGCLGVDGEGWFDPWALVHALKAKSRQMGVDWVNGHVHALDTVPAAAAEGASGANVRIEAVRVREAKTGEEVAIRCGQVVNAAGAF